MGLLKKLLARKDNTSYQGSNHSFQKFANVLAPENPDPKSDYVIVGTICGGIDSIAQDIGSDALDKITIVLKKDGDVSVVFSNNPFKPAADVKSFFPLKSYDKMALLKKAAGKRDNLNYMIVDIAGREILKRLKEQS